MTNKKLLLTASITGLFLLAALVGPLWVRWGLLGLFIGLRFDTFDLIKRN